MSIEIFKTRRSIKKYKPEQISEGELDLVLEAATYAPTGRNSQSPLIVAVQNPELVKKLSEANAKVLGMSSDPFYGAPTVVIVFADPAHSTGFEDACLVAGNILNAAHATGLGSCWIHRAREVFDTELGKALMREWGVPERYVGVANCILGYAAEAPATRPRKENYIIKVK
ncbi:MAG: nitroreductase [Clostridia bacterium]|nr:nitroreductase [Clostridia bacterium]